MESNIPSPVFLVDGQQFAAIAGDMGGVDVSLSSTDSTRVLNAGGSM
jgi:hypothetical protein